MPQTKTKGRLIRCLLIPAGLVVLAVLLLTVTRPLAHLSAPFTPDYPKLDLTPLLDGHPLTDEEYETLFLQTGLGRAGVDAWLALGQAGTQAILDTQEAFFRSPQSACDPLAVTTWEDHHVDESGNIVYGFPMAPLEDADVLLSFSTHTLGWRHGHAGLVVDGDEGLTLEAVLIGSDSAVVHAAHWASYTTYLHLRLRDLTPQQQSEITSFAWSRLDGIPYHLTSGIFSPNKLQDPESSGLGAQCAYLVWYALAQAGGYDTDSDGGRIVTVGDIAQSPLFEVVQVYGMDPRDFLPQEGG